MNDKKTVIQIPEFDPSLLNQNFFRMTLLGASYSGKSVFIRKIYPYIASKYSKIVLFTPAFNADFYDEFLFDITDKKSGKVISQVFKFYTSDFQTVVQSIEMIRESNTTGVDTILIIMDDIISNKASKSDDFMRLFASCRHSQMSIIYCIQFQTHEYSNNSMRANSNIIVVTRPSTIASRKWVQKNIIEEAVARKLWDSNDKTVIETSKKIYGEVFKNMYDKAVVFNGNLMKSSQ